MNASSPSPIDPAQRRRGRRVLIAIVAIFFGPILLAKILNMNGLIPAPSTYGERFDPLIDLRHSPPRLADGSVYDWAPATRMRRLLVVAPAHCSDACARRAADLEKLREIFGRDAEHIELLWLGDYPAGAARPPGMRLLADDATLRAHLPKSTDPSGAPVYVVDPYGFVILRYPPEADIALMRKDLARLLKMQ